MKKRSILFLCSILLAFTACEDEYSELEEGMYAEFVTNNGTFIAELYFEATPMTVASFVSLAEGTSTMVDSTYQGEDFYDGIIFHRVIEDFMIQTGDPMGTGSGGPGYEFPNEIVDTLEHGSAGILSMANSGPDTNGSQFFITLEETPWLNGIHTVFGEVVQGMEVVNGIGAVETAVGDKPMEDITMQEVNIIRRGDNAEDFNAPQVFEQELQQQEAEALEQEAAMAEQSAATAEEFEEMRAEAEELDSGLEIYYVEESDGETPELGETVLVNYSGYLANGQLFDTNNPELAEEMGIFNQQRMDQGGYNPMPMEYSPESPMIPGFREGILEMNVGDEAVLFIPSHLGYGERGQLPVIPSNSDLVFEVELVGVQGEEPSDQ